MEMVYVACIFGVMLILALILILFQARLISKKDIQKLFPRTLPPEHNNCKSTFVSPPSGLPNGPVPLDSLVSKCVGMRNDFRIPIRRVDPSGHPDVIHLLVDRRIAVELKAAREYIVGDEKSQVLKDLVDMLSDGIPFFGEKSFWFGPGMTSPPGYVTQINDVIHHMDRENEK